MEVSGNGWEHLFSITLLIQRFPSMFFIHNKDFYSQEFLLSRSFDLILKLLFFCIS